VYLDADTRAKLEEAAGQVGLSLSAYLSPILRRIAETKGPSQS
jgi:hypothetical protein